MTTRHQTSELSRGLRRRRVRTRSKYPERDHSENVDVTEYRGRESYEQQTAEGRGGQSGIFDQPDYPPRNSVPGEPPRDDDGHLAPTQQVDDVEAKPDASGRPS